MHPDSDIDLRLGILDSDKNSNKFRMLVFIDVLSVRSTGVVLSIGMGTSIMLLTGQDLAGFLARARILFECVCAVSFKLRPEAWLPGGNEGLYGSFQESL